MSKSVNSLWPSDVFWQHSSGSTMAQVLTCCLRAPSHYLNQSCFLISEVLGHSPETSNFAANAQTTLLYNEFENYTFKIMITPPRNQWVNTLRSRQNGCNFADNIFKGIFMNENVWILIKISLKFVPRCPIKNIPALVQKMASRWQPIIWTNGGWITRARTCCSASMS